LRLEGQEIAFTDTVLDPKLNWKQHLTDKRKKFYSSLWVCRRAMGKTWGINSKLALLDV
jgi:phosphopantetheinyl transferase